MSTVKLLTVTEAAQAANLSAETIRSYERRGKLRAIKVGSKGMRLFNELDILGLKSLQGTRRTRER